MTIGTMPRKVSHHDLQYVTDFICATPIGYEVCGTEDSHQNVSSTRLQRAMATLTEPTITRSTVNS